jgi:hypothetical protein
MRRDSVFIFLNMAPQLAIVISTLVIVIVDVLITIGTVPSDAPAVEYSTSLWILLFLGTFVLQLLLAGYLLHSYNSIKGRSSRQIETIRIFAVYLLSFYILFTLGVFLPIVAHYGSGNMTRARAYYFVHVIATFPALPLALMSIYRLWKKEF